MNYSETLDALVQRILELIPAHPEILSMNDPFKLLKVQGFYCNDLEVSLAQASAALAQAQFLWKQKI